jgi:dCMP deaminase
MTKDSYYMNLAIQVSLRSKCLRAKYGTILVSQDERIVATGYNGKPRNSLNDDVCYRDGLLPNAPKENCCLHSEANCLLFSEPQERTGGTLYVSGIPCADCMLLIMQSGISRLVGLSRGHQYNGLNIAAKYGVDLDITIMEEAELCIV